jgi:uncharacterized protein YndB with AHSA1/START domain
MTSDLNVETAGAELILTRTFDAPRDLVFAAYSSCEYIKNWFGSRSCRIVECTMDFRVGGFWHYCLRDPGTDAESWTKAVYLEIVEPALIAYSSAFADAEGNIDETKLKTQSRVELSEVDARTRLTLRVKCSSPSDLQQVLGMGIILHSTEALDRLEQHLRAPIAESESHPE